MSVLVKENGELTTELPVVSPKYFSQIVSRKPGWLLESAPLAYILIFLLIIAATWMIRYPEIVKTKATITGAPTGNIYYAEMDVPRKEMVKLLPGQQVRLYIEGYPSGDFGFVQGIVKQLPDTITDNDFKIYIALPAGLITSHHKKIPYRTRLTADAIIVIKDMRLLQRIFYRSASKVHL